MRKIAVLLGLVMIVVGVTAVATDLGIAEKRDIKFYDPVVIGNKLVPAGEYTVLHQMQGKDHIMVFTKVGKKPLEARVKCSLTPLKATAERTEVEYRLNDKKEHVLSRLVFRGDKAEHIF
jgi:hypothetical protein